MILAGIDTIFNVLIHGVLQHIAIIGCTDLNNMTNKLLILKVQVRLLSLHCNRIGSGKKIGLFCYKILHFHYLSIVIYHCIMILLGQIPSQVIMQVMFYALIVTARE